MADDEPTDPVPTDSGRVEPAPADSRSSDSKITKVIVKPGKQLTKKPAELTSKYLSQLPLMPSNPAPYQPIPYTFRVPTLDAQAPVKIDKVWARSPPFCTLFDHTISVIWLLFGEMEYDCPLGIVQLHWALAFLKTIHTRQGNYPRDVEICIDAIEELLIENFAELSKELPEVKKMDETVHYAKGAFGSTTMVTINIPFSLNYAEMIDKSMDSDVSVKKSITSAQAEEELENLKKAAGVESMMKLDSVSKDKAINILKLWKADQIEKIKDELRRLRSIENQMNDIDDNFDGYIEDDLEVLIH